MPGIVQFGGRTTGRGSNFATLCGRGGSRLVGIKVYSVCRAMKFQFRRKWGIRLHVERLLDLQD